MAIEAAMGFVQLVMEDEELRQRTADLKPEEVVDIAKEKGFVFTAEELTEASNEVREITSDELEAATGGGSNQVVPSNSHARAKKIWCKGEHKNGKHNYVFPATRRRNVFGGLMDIMSINAHVAGLNTKYLQTAKEWRNIL